MKPCEYPDDFRLRVLEQILAQLVVHCIIVANSFP